MEMSIATKQIMDVGQCMLASSN